MFTRFFSFLAKSKLQKVDSDEIILKMPYDCNSNKKGFNSEFIRQNIQFINSKVSKNPAKETNEMKMIFEPNRK